MKDNQDVPDWLARSRQEREAFNAMTCIELSSYLEQNWEILWEGRQMYLASTLAHKGCQEAIPYLLRLLESQDPSHRWRALSGLKELECRDCRPIFINFYLNDPDEEVRSQSLFYLSCTFRDKDLEILQMALAAFDNPANSVSMRVIAAAAMFQQLDVPKELGVFPWWNDEDEENLHHPTLLWTVAETRRVLAEAAKGRPDIAAGVNTES